MARQIDGRVRLTGTLIADKPLHVGGYGEDVDTDLPLARDGATGFGMLALGVGALAVARRRRP